MIYQRSDLSPVLDDFFGGAWNMTIHEALCNLQKNANVCVYIIYLFHILRFKVDVYEKCRQMCNTWRICGIRYMLGRLATNKWDPSMAYLTTDPIGMWSLQHDQCKGERTLSINCQPKRPGFTSQTNPRWIYIHTPTIRAKMRFFSRRPTTQAVKKTPKHVSTAFFVCGMSLWKSQQFKKLGPFSFTLVSRLLMVHDAEEKKYQIEIVFSIQSSPNTNLLRGLHGNRFNKKHEWAPTSTSYKWS